MRRWPEVGITLGAFGDSDRSWCSVIAEHKRLHAVSCRISSAAVQYSSEREEIASKSGVVVAEKSKGSLWASPASAVLLRGDSVVELSTVVEVALTLVSWLFTVTTTSSSSDKISRDCSLYTRHHHSDDLIWAVSGSDSESESCKCRTSSYSVLACRIEVVS